MKKWTFKQTIYLILAFLGFVLPLYFVFQFFGEMGQLDWNRFFAAAFANPASSSLTVDFMIVLVGFVVWMISEARELGMRNWWIYLVLIGFVSAAFGIPLFLFMRERHFQSIIAENP